LRRVYHQEQSKCTTVEQTGDIDIETNENENCEGVGAFQRDL